MIQALRSTRYVLTFLGFWAFFLNYALRVNLSVALVAMVNHTAINKAPKENYTGEGCDKIQKTDDATQNGSFEWEESLQGLILSAFFWGYLLTNLPGGRLAERYGGKLLLGVGMFLTALVTLLTPVSAYCNPVLLIALRVVMGLALGVSFPAMHAMCSSWMAPEERSKLTAIIYTGCCAGVIFSFPVTGFISAKFGWEASFYFMGSLGLLWTAVWCCMAYDTPDQHPRITVDELSYITKAIGESRARKSPPLSWRCLLTSLPVWSLVLVQVGSDWINYTFSTSIPAYMKNIMQLNIGANGIVTGVPYLIVWLTGYGYSWAADKFINNNIMSRTNTRKLFTAITTIAQSVFLISAGYIGCDTASVLTVLYFGSVCGGAIFGSFMPNHIDLAPNYAGTLFGLANTFSTISGMVVPIYNNYLVQGQQTVGQWHKVFITAAAVNSISGIIYLAFGSGEEQSWNRNGGKRESQEEAPTVLTTIS